MKTPKRIVFIVTVALIIISLPTQANNQTPTPCPTPTPEPIIYSTAGLMPTIPQRDKALYTVKARDEKIQGTVVLQVVFHQSGRITDIRVIKELPHGLTEQAIGTAYRMKFTPAMKDGKPVSVRGSLVYKFQLY